MPDFDIDFCQEGRDRVIQYVKDRYGKDAVSQIATFGTMAAKGATDKVEKLLDPDAPKDPVCKDCSDERKDKPITGLTIIRNVKQSADDKAVFDGGDILDPNNGKVYKLLLKPIDGGKKLEVRGYIGMALLGRTQTWVRVE